MKKPSKRVLREMRRLRLDIGPEAFEALMAAQGAAEARGGRPKGSGQDYTAVLAAMADLLVAMPGLTQRAAAQTVTAAFPGFSFESVRKRFRENRQQLLAQARARLAPPAPLARRVDRSITLLELQQLETKALEAFQKLGGMETLRLYEQAYKKVIEEAREHQRQVVARAVQAVTDTLLQSIKTLAEYPDWRKMLDEPDD